MTPDQPESTSNDEPENAVLPDRGSIDTTAIGILGGATAQVDVVIPGIRVADPGDDDVVDDEIRMDAVAAIGAPAMPVLGDPDGGDAPVERANDDGPEETQDAVLVAGEELDTATADVRRDERFADHAALQAVADAPARSEVEPAPQTEHRRVRTSEVRLRSKRIDQFEPGREGSDLLTADRLLEPGRVVRAEPEGGWQHFVYRVSGGHVNLGDGRRARARKALDTRIGAPLHGGAKFVPVLSRKGGVGKTTVTALLGMALADARDDRVIAIDANPDRGTLAERLAHSDGRTVRDLARSKGRITGYNDVSEVVARDRTRLDVLASDADPRVSEAFSDRDYEDVADLAAHYYSIILTDTGTGIVHSVMSATLAAADQLVVVSGLSVDEARLASETLTWLESNGYAGHVRETVVVLNASRPGPPLVREAELEAHFRTRVRTVVRLPYDPLIAAGSAISFHDLRPETCTAARELAAVVIEGLRDPAMASSR